MSLFPVHMTLSQISLACHDQVLDKGVYILLCPYTKISCVGCAVVVLCTT